MAIGTISRADIERLCERLQARGTSRMLRHQPELQADMRLAAYILQCAVTLAGFPVTPLEVPEWLRNG